MTKRNEPKSAKRNIASMSWCSILWREVSLRVFSIALLSHFLRVHLFKPIFQRVSATMASPAHSAFLLSKILLLIRLRIRPCRNRLLQTRRRSSSTALLLDFRWTSFLRLTVRSARFTLTGARCVKRRKRCFWRQKFNPPNLLNNTIITWFKFSHHVNHMTTSDLMIGITDSESDFVPVNYFTFTCLIK